jgi:hypothetical protein
VNRYPLLAALPLAVLCFAVLPRCAQAQSAELKEAERRAVAMVVDFCGTLAGEEPPAPDAAAARVPGLKLGPPVKVSAISAEEGVRHSFREFFSIGDDEELRFAGFTDSPSRNERPYAAFKPDGENCIVVLTPGSRAAHDEIQRRFAASGGTWRREDTRSGDQVVPTWHRDAPFGEKVFVAGHTDAEGTIYFASMEQRDVPSPLEVRTIAHAAIAPCVAGILSDKPPGSAEFSEYFGEVRQRQEGEVHILTLRSKIAGPRAILEALRVERVSKCQLFLAHTSLPMSTMGEYVLSAVRALPGVREVTQAANGDRPARQAWRWIKPGQAQAVDFVVHVDEANGMVVLDVAWAQR